MDEGAQVFIFDPKVKHEQIMMDLKAVSAADPSRVEKLVTIVTDPYEAMKDAHGIAFLTEWDEFKSKFRHTPTEILTSMRSIRLPAGVR